ncbi:MAG: DUF1320 family protein [Victivallaceae bacterium]|nr:DUF1320 family protein [Victivallaceae bacterium]
MYATVENLAERLGTPFGAIYRNEAALPLSDLEEASAEIDGYLAKRYVCPVTEPGALLLLRKWCLALAQEAAYRRSGGAALPEKVKDAAAETRKILREVSSGVFALPASPVEAAQVGGAGVYAECDEAVFTRETMKGY